MLIQADTEAEHVLRTRTEDLNRPVPLVLQGPFPLVLRPNPQKQQQKQKLSNEKWGYRAVVANDRTPLGNRAERYPKTRWCSCSFLFKV